MTGSDLTLKLLEHLEPAYLSIKAELEQTGGTENAPAMAVLLAGYSELFIALLREGHPSEPWMKDVFCEAAKVSGNRNPSLGPYRTEPRNLLGLLESFQLAAEDRGFREYLSQSFARHGYAFQPTDWRFDPLASALNSLVNQLADIIGSQVPEP